MSLSRRHYTSAIYSLNIPQPSKKEATLVLCPTLFRYASDYKCFHQIPERCRTHPKDIQWTDRFGNCSLHILCQKDLLPHSRLNIQPAMVFLDAVTAIISIRPDAIMWPNVTSSTPFHYVIKSATKALYACRQHEIIRSNLQGTEVNNPDQLLRNKMATDSTSDRIFQTTKAIYRIWKCILLRFMRACPDVVNVQTRKGGSYNLMTTLETSSVANQNVAAIETTFQVACQGSLDYDILFEMLSINPNLATDPASSSKYCNGRNQQVTIVRVKNDESYHLNLHSTCNCRQTPKPLQVNYSESPLSILWKYSIKLFVPMDLITQKMELLLYTAYYGRVPNIQIKSNRNMERLFSIDEREAGTINTDVKSCCTNDNGSICSQSSPLQGCDCDPCSPRKCNLPDNYSTCILRATCAIPCPKDFVTYALKTYSNCLLSGDEEGNLPLHCAITGNCCLSYRKFLIKSILSHCPSAAARTNLFGRLPLHVALAPLTVLTMDDITSTVSVESDEASGTTMKQIDYDPMVVIRDKAKRLATGNTNLSNSHLKTLDIVLNTSVGQSWYDGGLRELVDAYPEALLQPDPITRLVPYLTSAVTAATFYSNDSQVHSHKNLQCIERHNLSTMYELLRAAPEVIRQFSRY